MIGQSFSVSLAVKALIIINHALKQFLNVFLDAAQNGLLMSNDVCKTLVLSAYG